MVGNTLILKPPSYAELGKISSLKAETFLIRTNVARPNLHRQISPQQLNLLEMVPGTYLRTFVKIMSVTAELFLIWTNVTWTNVARTNVTLTLGMCSRWSQEPTFKALSKSVQ